MNPDLHYKLCASYFVTRQSYCCGHGVLLQCIHSSVVNNMYTHVHVVSYFVSTFTTNTKCVLASSVDPGACHNDVVLGAVYLLWRQVEHHQLCPASSPRRERREIRY